MSQQRAAELQLSEDELVMARSELDALHDELYILACAVDDTDRDLRSGGHSKQDILGILQWLLEAARPLRDRELTAPAGPDL